MHWRWSRQSLTRLRVRLQYLLSTCLTYQGIFHTKDAIYEYTVLYNCIIAIVWGTVFRAEKVGLVVFWGKSEEYKTRRSCHWRHWFDWRQSRSIITTPKAQCSSFSSEKLKYLTFYRSLQPAIRFGGYHRSGFPRYSLRRGGECVSPCCKC